MASQSCTRSVGVSSLPLARKSKGTREGAGMAVDDVNTGPADERYSMPLELSNEMVRLYKTLFGRGPTRARTSFAGPDVIVCTLENSLTKAEQNMAALGEHQRLRDVRMFFQ